MIEKFSKKEAIKFGWQTAKKNLKFFVPLLLFVFLVSFSLDFFAAFFEKRIILFSFLLRIVEWVLSIIFSLGWIRIYLNFYDKSQVKFSQIFSQYKLFFRYLFAQILYNLIQVGTISLFAIPILILAIILARTFSSSFWFVKSVLIGGIVLFVVLGIVLLIIFAIRFSFFDYFIVDKKAKIIESLKRSWQITKGNTLNLFLLYLLFALINILGAFALLIGLFLTIPTTMLAEAFVYRKLLHISERSNQLFKIKI